SVYADDAFLEVSVSHGDRQHQCVQRVHLLATVALLPFFRTRHRKRSGAVKAFPRTAWMRAG
ncbi:hypothetical protein ACDI96_26320, partial [Citrobacter telavivensis]